MKVVDPMVGLLILAVLSVLSIVSLIYGVDSRDGSTDPRGPIFPVGLR
jgi:hypothetical protein